MKYRIITNGARWVVQIKTWSGWVSLNVDPTNTDCAISRTEYFVRYFNSEDAAEQAAAKLWGTTRKRVREWRTA